MHTAFKRNHIKLLSVGYIQYNLGTLGDPENISVVFKRISVTNLCWCGCSKVLLFFAVWVVAYPRIEYWEELKRIVLLWYGGRRKAIFSLHYSLQCCLFFTPQTLSKAMHSLTRLEECRVAVLTPKCQHTHHPYSIIHLIKGHFY